MVNAAIKRRPGLKGISRPGSGNRDELVSYGKSTGTPFHPSTLHNHVTPVSPALDAPPPPLGDGYDWSLT